MLMKVREANFKGRFVRVHWLATIFYGSRALFFSPSVSLRLSSPLVLKLGGDNSGGRW